MNAFDQKVASFHLQPVKNLSNQLLRKCVSLGITSHMDLIHRISVEQGWEELFGQADWDNLPHVFNDAPYDLELMDRERQARDKVRQRQWSVRFMRCGMIEKSPCEICGDPVVHCHHIPQADGSYHPERVKWLCPTHHREEHRLLKSKAVSTV